MTGFGFVLFASMGICVSLNMQKISHMRVAQNAAVTGQPEQSFLKMPFWWAGVLLNVVSHALYSVGQRPPQ